MSAESAHLSTFGAETETEAEIRSTSSWRELMFIPEYYSPFFSFHSHMTLPLMLSVPVCSEEWHQTVNCCQQTLQSFCQCVKSEGVAGV